MNQRNEHPEDDSSSPERYLQRPWKLFKPHLPRSDSLPDLSLIPHERPMFTCSNCNFSNTIVDICLWCPPILTSNNSNQENDPGVKRRRRRVSAPSRLLCWQPIRPRPRSQALPSTPPVSALNFSENRRRSSRLSATNNSTNHSPHRLLPLSRVDEDESDRVLNKPNSETVATVRRDVVTATSSSSLSSPPASPHQRQLDESVVHNHQLRSLPLGSSRAGSGHGKHDLSSSSGGCVDRGSLPTTLNFVSGYTMKPSCTLSSRVRADLSNSPSSSKIGEMQSVPARTLRRKRSHLVLHLSAPPSSSTTVMVTMVPNSSNLTRPRPQSQPYLSSPSSQRIPITEMKKHMSIRAQTQPELSQTHLGHPNRPYYTALRRDMSLSGSRLDFVSTATSTIVEPSSSNHNHSRSSSPMFYPPYPASFSDDSHELSSAEFSSQCGSGVSFTPFGLVIPPTTAAGNHSSSSSNNMGFQLPLLNLKKFRRNSHGNTMMFTKSDEIRLRLALAREVGGGIDVKVDQGYVYQGGGMANVKMHLRRLSRGLKDLVMINTTGKRRA